MRLTMDKIKTLVTSGDLIRGKHLYNDGQVSKLNVTQDDADGETRYSCQVKDGTTNYTVNVVVGESKVRTYCSCYGWMGEDVWMCEHAAAAFFAVLDSQTASAPINADNSDAFAQRVMRSYLDLEMNPQAPKEQHGSVRLVPKLDLDHSGDSYPSFILTVGTDRMYVVKNVKEFAGNVINRKTVSYGKSLTLFHGVEMFDERSQELLNLVLDNFRQFRDFNPSYIDRTADAYAEGDSKELLTLTGSFFDRFFDILKGQSIERRTAGITPVALTQRDPHVSFSLAPAGDSVELTINSPEQLRFFGNSRSLYAITQNEILKLSPAFFRRVYPFLKDGTKVMRIASADMPSYANFVLKKLAEVAPLEDPQDLLNAYFPDDLTPRFYFDIMDNGDLTLRVVFLYGEEEVPSDTPAAKTPAVKRNAMAEQDVLMLVDRHFTRNKGTYLLSGDDAIYNFLLDGIEEFRFKGEVFITDRLRARELQPKVSTVGVSVSDGFLSLIFDTGDFPTTELEDLYDSMLQKRRYYKLRDGRILRLEGSSYETLAEMSHMLRLTPKDLANGKVQLPAFRALYVDSLLSKNENFNVTRNKQYRSMIRSFKSVAESDYAVPEHLDAVMRPYQKIGFQWLKTLESCNFGGILADEMGLGKTVEAIAYLCTVPRSQVNMPSLIVCPASLILNWMDEFARFGPELKPLAIMGTAAERKNLIAAKGAEADVWVTSYELLRQDIKTYQSLSFYCCILDEGQHVKNQTTQASKAVKLVNCTQRYILTGTPIENRLSELWNLFDFLMPGYLFAHNTFVEKLEKPVVKSKDEEAMAQLRKLVQPFMLRRLKKDVLKELPPIIEHVHRIPLSEDAKKIYSATVLKTRAALDDTNGSKLAILAALTKLRQICCDPNLCFENYNGKSDKLDACMDLCAGMVENGHQILLFSQFTSMLDRIRARLDEAGISNFTLQGSTTKEARARLVKEFNAGGASVFLISLKAGGTGLNLTAADVVIHYDPWWNTAAQDQATGRAHRIGQQENVQVYKLITQDTIEERIMDLQERKAFLMDAITDESGASLLSMSKEDLLALLN